MKNIGIIYGSSTGTCQDMAQKIAELLPGDVVDVSNMNQEKFENYDVLLLGSSTWGFGELQDDWDSALSKLKSANLSGKSVGFFGCGDADGYPDTFCDAIGIIYKAIENSGCTFIGKMPIGDISFDESAAVIDGELVGVVADDINESDKTEERIATWVEIIKSQI